MPRGAVSRKTQDVIFPLTAEKYFPNLVRSKPNLDRNYTFPIALADKRTSVRCPNQSLISVNYNPNLVFDWQDSEESSLGLNRKVSLSFECSTSAVRLRYCVLSFLFFGGFFVFCCFFCCLVSLFLCFLSVCQRYGEEDFFSRNIYIRKVSLCGEFHECGAIVRCFPLFGFQL